MICLIGVIIFGFFVNFIKVIIREVRFCFVKFFFIMVDETILSFDIILIFNVFIGFNGVCFGFILFKIFLILGENIFFLTKGFV